MGAGKIVISSNTQGGKELITKNNGFIFKDELELIKTLNDCAKNHKKLDKFRINARKFAEKLTWDKIVDKLEKLYK